MYMYVNPVICIPIHYHFRIQCSIGIETKFVCMVSVVSVNKRMEVAGVLKKKQHRIYLCGAGVMGKEESKMSTKWFGKPGQGSSESRRGEL